MIAMSLGLLSILVLDCLNNKKKTDFLTQQIKSQQKQIRKYQKEYFELRKFKHDYNNNIKLLKEMKNFKGNDRSAKFVCVIAVVFEDGTINCIRGEVKGSIIEELKTEGGFGYDPLFFCDKLNKTFGEATPKEKNEISHRGNALKRLKEILA